MAKKKTLSLLCVVTMTFLSACNFNETESKTDVISQVESIIQSEQEKSEPEVSESKSEEIESVVSEQESEQPSIEDSTEISEEPSYDVNEDFEFGKYGVGEPKVKQMTQLPDYTPTTINLSTYTSTTTSLGTGVDLVSVNYKLTNGRTISPKCVVVDLTKANIVAGSYNNSTDPATYGSKSTPYAQATAWEKANPNKKVIAVTNADYFGTLPVNAFVKDGVILKDSHNSDPNDVPKSRPMLFGVSSAGAKIDSMTHYEDYSTNQNSTLKSTGLVLLTAEHENKGVYGYRADFMTSETGIGVMTIKDVAKPVKMNSKVYKFKKIQKDQCKDGEIRGCLVEEIKGETLLKITNDDYGYIAFGVKYKGNKIGVGDYFSIVNNSVLSDDGVWNGYDTIIGARHSLIENGLIPSTVAQEGGTYGNGAESHNPRSAVGILDDGRVVIVSIEDLNRYSDSSTGLTLTQLADFMRYFGCYDACNFDGGGSSQLLTKSGLNGQGNYVVTTRSSDTSSTDPGNTRPVINTIIVTTK